MHILDSLNRGGAEMLALDVCRNARANNLDLIFVATGGGDLEAEFQSSGVDFVRLQRQAPFDVRLVAALRRLIRERGIEIIHCHQAVEALHAYAATAGLKTEMSIKHKHVLSFHLCTADRKNTFALKFLAPRMDANIAVSHDLLQCLARAGGFDVKANFHVVHNGVDARRLQRLQGEREGDASASGGLRRELGLGEDDVLFGMVGNFYPDARKDQMTVCRALPALFAQKANAHFVFIGARSSDAPHIYDDCVAYCCAHGIADRARFLGKREDIANVLRALDVFVFPSREEGLGIAAIEAMMMGLPLVVSDIAVLREVTADGKHALVFKTGDAEDLTRRLIEINSDASLRRQMGGATQEWATQQFGIESHINKLKELYEKLT